MSIYNESSSNYGNGSFRIKAELISQLKKQINVLKIKVDFFHTIMGFME